jgi:hypothetical protein
MYLSTHCKPRENSSGRKHQKYIKQRINNIKHTSFPTNAQDAIQKHKKYEKLR